MEPKTETYIDKSSWKRGEWDNEPDRIEWRHKGLPCLIVRGPFGALCGYVAVAPGHPYHGKPDGELNLECHGGLTYSAACQEDGKICHVPLPGESPNVWWLGFDCIHFGDYAPTLGNGSLDHGIYRDVTYVTRQVESLAEQLHTEAIRS